MIVERVLAAEINRGNLRVTDEEIRALFNERKDEMPLRPAVVHLATIYLSFDSSESAVIAAKQKIDDLYRRVTSGEDFAEVAREYSEDPSAESGGRLGTVRPDGLRSNQQRAGTFRILGRQPGRYRHAECDRSGARREHDWRSLDPGLQS